QNILLLAAQISRPGVSGRGDVRLTHESHFWMRCGLCAGMPARSTVRRDGDEVWVEDVSSDAPVSSSTSNQTIVAERGTEGDGRMIYGVNEAITGMVLRRLKNQGSYDILMNGFSLQSNTTPRKACK
ncbi:unnamed protein product, partial [Prunus brigantina]